MISRWFLGREQLIPPCSWISLNWKWWQNCSPAGILTVFIHYNLAKDEYFQKKSVCSLIVLYSKNNSLTFDCSDNKIKREKLLVRIWPALCDPAERLSSSRLTHALNTPKIQTHTPTWRAWQGEWKIFRKGQGLWINCDRATGIWTQMAHNLPSPCELCSVTLFLPLWPKTQPKHSFRPSYIGVKDPVVCSRESQRGKKGPMSRHPRNSV